MKLITSLLLVLISSIASTSWAQENCQPKQIDEWVQARIAQSGNSVIVNNRQFLIAGVYAPELGNPSNRSDPPRPMARESLTNLNRILANNDRKIGIQYDQQKVDAFGRVTAHLFLEDGRNIGEMMIESGLALAVANLPNLDYQACYFAAEQRARAASRGLWRLTTTQPQLKYPIALSSQISDMDNGFRIIRGEVRTVSRSSNNYIINLDTTGIRIQKKYWDQFNFADLEKLKDQTIEVRGSGFAHQGAMYVVIQHPHMIDKLNPYQQ